MRTLREWALSTLQRRVTQKREPDFIIGEADNPYLRRWFVIPRNRFFNIYLHHFLRSDDDRAVHDHPWAFGSWLMQGSYMETTEIEGRRQSSHVPEGSFRFRRSTFAHIIELHEGPVWTLFLTGPRQREWGFHCPKGWRHWRDFTAPETNGATVGRGCD